MLFYDVLFFDSGFNEQNIVFCMALFHLPINIPASFGFKAKRWRPTVKSSKNSVFKRVYSGASIAKAMQVRKAARDKQDIEEHPLIYGIGEYFDEMSEFYVAMGDILYKFNSFIEALDASFKCYKVLKRDYPKDSAKFWNFIDSVFYKTRNEQNSQVLAVINSFQFD